MASHAVIVGGGLAGFCCARAVSRFYDRVTLVERDALPDGVMSRTGTPQTRHAHVILDRGRRELEHLFPGFERRMLEQGAISIDPGMQFATRGAGGWGVRLPTSARNICASRDLTDATVRELAAQLPNVEIRSRSEVSELRIETRSGTRHVTGVEVHDLESGLRTDLAADLVVDAAGRGSKARGMLQRAGVSMPEETVIDSDTWYVTRWFKSAPGHALPAACWWKAVIMVPHAAAPTGALMTPVEGDRWVVSMATVGLGQPRIDEENFLSKLRELPSPIIAEALGEAISPVYKSRSTPNRRFHFERWGQSLAGFVAVGDSACVFNPVQGQGVTSTAVCAHVLEDALAAEGPSSRTLAARFFKAQAGWQSNPWGLATGFDLRFPSTPGKRKLMPRLFAPYLKLFAGAAKQDLPLLKQIGEVGQLNAPVASLMSPAIVARVLRLSVTRGARPAVAGTGEGQGAYPPAHLFAAPLEVRGAVA